MVSLIDYIKSIIRSILHSLGLYKKSGTILFLGLDNAGKTTLLHRLRTNKLLSSSFPSPTDRPHHEEFYMEQIRFLGWDLGGHEAVRNIWGDYVVMDGIDGIFFMIDASDYDRFDEVGVELDELIHGERGLLAKDEGGQKNNNHGDDDNMDYVSKRVPLAILLNKCDLEAAYDSEVIQDQIGYDKIIKDYEIQIQRPTLNDDANEKELIRMFRISVWRGEGYQEAFQWISTYL